MFISDLSFLSTESALVTGGAGTFKLDVDQSNRAKVDQYATSYADAEAFRGNARADADSSNYSRIYQSNYNRSWWLFNLIFPLRRIEEMILKYENHWILSPQRQVTSGFLLVSYAISLKIRIPAKVATRFYWKIYIIFSSLTYSFRKMDLQENAMIISDLSYLGEVSQAPGLSGGLGSFSQNIVQYDIANVRQYATANSTAEAFRGNATAISNAYNISFIGQSSTTLS
jgi:hypothetical protein